MQKGPLRKIARLGKGSLTLVVRRWRWYARNRHNETWNVNLFDIDRVSVGAYSYGPLRVIDGGGSSCLSIGSLCSIADNVTFVLSGEHRLNAITTFPLRTFVLGMPEVALSHGDIVVEDDVWIGHGATILSGIRLGQGCVVAAGAVVTRDVDPYSIVGGVPAREIATRVPRALIPRVRQLNLGRLDSENVAAHLGLLERPLDDQALAELEELLDHGE